MLSRRDPTIPWKQIICLFLLLAESKLFVPLPPRADDGHRHCSITELEGFGKPSSLPFLLSGWEAKVQKCTVSCPGVQRQVASLEVQPRLSNSDWCPLGQSRLDLMVILLIGKAPELEEKVGSKRR